MFSKKIPFFITFATFSLFPIAANALSLGGVMDNGPGDLDPEIGSIVVAGLGVSVLSTTIPGNVDIDVDAKANASDNGVTLSILGTIINDTNEELSFILTSSVSYNLDVDVPEDGFIFAGLNASLFDLKSFRPFQLAMVQMLLLPLSLMVLHLTLLALLIAFLQM